jgi:PKD repeat protein
MRNIVRKTGSIIMLLALVITACFVIVPGNMNAANQPPVAIAIPENQTVYVGEPANFDGSNSYDPDGSIVSFEWDFGDGSTGYGVEEFHYYYIPGIYGVWLNVTDNEGASDWDMVTVTVLDNGTNQPPVADADPDTQTIEIGETAYFNGTNSYDPDGTIVSYDWDFGDGNMGSGITASHVYSTDGIFTVTLTVTDNDGANDTDTCVVTVLVVYPAPPTDFWAVLVPGSLGDVRLEWTASLDDGAGRDDVAGYTIYKSTNDVNGPFNFEAWIEALDLATYEWTDHGTGDGDTNNYFYIVRANNTLNNEEQNENKVGKFSCYLEEGWNLNSVPLVQKDTSREVVLQTLDPNYSAVRGHKAGYARPWLNWHKDKPNQMNDEVEINHKDGYYIYMTSADYLVTAGQVASQTDIPLKAGWNLVGYPFLSERTRNDALSSIDGNYNKVLYSESGTKKEKQLGPDELMIPGEGYWIHATADCTWTI